MKKRKAAKNTTTSKENWEFSNCKNLRTNDDKNNEIILLNNNYSSKYFPQRSGHHRFYKV